MVALFFKCLFMEACPNFLTLSFGRDTVLRDKKRRAAACNLTTATRFLTRLDASLKASPPGPRSLNGLQETNNVIVVNLCIWLRVPPRSLAPASPIELCMRSNVNVVNSGSWQSPPARYLAPASPIPLSVSPNVSVVSCFISLSTSARPLEPVAPIELPPSSKVSVFKCCSWLSTRERYFISGDSTPLQERSRCNACTSSLSLSNSPEIFWNA